MSVHDILIALDQNKWIVEFGLTNLKQTLTSLDYPNVVNLHTAVAIVRTMSADGGIALLTCPLLAQAIEQLVICLDMETKSGNFYLYTMLMIARTFSYSQGFITSKMFLSILCHLENCKTEVETHTCLQTSLAQLLPRNTSEWHLQCCHFALSTCIISCTWLDVTLVKQTVQTLCHVETQYVRMKSRKNLTLATTTKREKPKQCKFAFAFCAFLKVCLQNWLRKSRNSAKHRRILNEESQKQREIRRKQKKERLQTQKHKKLEACCLAVNNITSIITIGDTVLECSKKHAPFSSPTIKSANNDITSPAPKAKITSTTTTTTTTTTIKPNNTLCDVVRQWVFVKAGITYWQKRVSLRKLTVEKNMRKLELKRAQKLNEKLMEHTKLANQICLHQELLQRIMHICVLCLNRFCNMMVNKCAQDEDVSESENNSMLALIKIVNKYKSMKSILKMRPPCSIDLDEICVTIRSAHHVKTLETYLSIDENHKSFMGTVVVFSKVPGIIAKFRELLRQLPSDPNDRLHILKLAFSEEGPQKVSQETFSKFIDTHTLIKSIFLLNQENATVAVNTFFDGVMNGHKMPNLLTVLDTVYKPIQAYVSNPSNGSTLATATVSVTNVNRKKENIAPNTDQLFQKIKELEKMKQMSKTNSLLSS